MLKTLQEIISATDKAAELIWVRNKDNQTPEAKAHYDHNIRIRNKLLTATDRQDEVTNHHFNFDPLK